MTDNVIRSAVFTHRPGSPVWQCHVCRHAFLWTDGSWAWCNGAEEPIAVVCGDACRERFAPPASRDAVAMPIGKVGPDGIPRGRLVPPLPGDAPRTGDGRLARAAPEAPTG